MTKQKKQSKGKFLEAPKAGTTLNLVVELPDGVQYVKATNFPRLVARSAASGKKVKRQPVQSGALVTWEDIGLARRSFKIRVRVDKATASTGMLLPFNATLFDSVPVGDTRQPACLRSVPLVTASVK